ncbi:MAG: arginine--tRNA ligase [Saprospiraceae bacterium]|jgi:arginyl-tRNA synthetase|nr:arginine--tRNA ligase [Saprospiraceae bacterium]
MDFLCDVKLKFVEGIKNCFDLDIHPDEVTINETRKEFKGDYTIVIFPLVKIIKKSPKEIGDKLGQWMVANATIIRDFETVQGFINFTFIDSFWQVVFSAITMNDRYGYKPLNGKKVMVEFSSPNTNKPLHLGHIRNILLGWSCSKILEANGYEVIKTQVINDRGIAICKSMLAWKKFGKGQTPASSGIKGDHFVGDFYVMFEKAFQEEYAVFQNSDSGLKFYESNKEGNGDKASFFSDYKNRYFNENSQLGTEAKQMLLDWESGSPEIMALWKQMNQWVYEGFDITYQALGVSFDTLYYESETYLLGKKAVDEGLDKGVFYRLDDGSVWVDLEDAGMDKKIVLRSDGTAVYMTQDIGTAQQRYNDYGIDKMVYTVADEQDYHFKVLFEILKRLKEPFADGLFHLSYGMIDLPTGKMKSREGTVVDADDLIAEVIQEARDMSSERGEIAVLSNEKQEEILKQIGLAALKFFIIKVQPQKRMIFDPKESVDMQGQTGPYIQNAFVRIQSIKRKAADLQTDDYKNYTEIHEQEKSLIKQLVNFPEVVRLAGETYEPSSIANYAYVLAKEFHRFYHDIRILNAETEEAKAFRVNLSNEVGQVLYKSFNLLGIEMPERM